MLKDILSNKKAVVKISLMFLIIISLVMTSILVVGLVMAATHTSTADLQPEWSASGQTMDYEVTISNEGPDTVDEVRIYKNENYEDFQCKEKTGWEMYYIAVLDACFYVHDPNTIPEGESETFSFSAKTSIDPEETCELEWEFETRDNADSWQYIYDTTSIDSEAPEITKEIIGPQVGLCPPGQGEECWVMNHKTQISVQVTDDISAACNSGIDYCTYTIILDGQQIFHHTFDPDPEHDPTLNIDWIFDFTEDSVHELYIKCEDVAGNVVEDTEVFRVDSTPPETTKIISEPKKVVQGPHGDVEWVDTATIITLNAVDPDPTTYGCNIGVKELYWANTLVDENACWEPDKSCNPIDGVYMEKVDGNEVIIQKDEESCHLLQYYAVDELGNTEGIKTNCFFVDKTPPIGTKTVGEPKISCSEGESVTGEDLVLILENKDSSTWEIKDGDGIKATLEYNDMGPEFKYSLTATGLQENIKYSLIYYADFDPRFEIWGGNNPGALITIVSTDVSGNIDTSGSTNLGMNLPSEPDWNINPSPDYCGMNNGFDAYEHCSGAKIWLVPSSDYDTVNKKVNKWNPTKWLFETDLIDYTFAECYWVRDPTNLEGTEITLDCEDVGPHPSGDEEVCFRVSYDIESWLTKDYCKGTMQGLNDEDWCCVDVSDNLYYTIIFQEDSLHDLEYFCRDAVDKKSEIDLEWFRVDSQPPIIEKNMFGNYLGDCPSGTDLEHGDCYVADDRTSGVEITAYDNETYGCAVDGVSCTYELWWKGQMIDQGQFNDYKEIIFTEDSTHTLKIWCEDALGNWVEDVETFLVDSKPPVTTKTYGEPQKVDLECEILCHNEYDGDVEECLHQYCTWWITSDTEISLTVEDEKVGQVYDNTIWWRNLYFPENDEICQKSTIANGGDYCHPEYYMGYADETVPDFQKYIEPFYKEEESCHVIEYYSIDALGNEEDIQWQCVFVDNTAPVSIKEHGEPLIPDNGFDWVTQDTLITLDCGDQDPHPVKQETLCYKVSLDDDILEYITDKYCEGGAVGDDYCCVYVGDDGSFELNFLENSNHNLEYYCVDHLGNDERDYNLANPPESEEGVITIDGAWIQWYKVDSTPPTVTKILNDPYSGDCPPEPGTNEECFVDTVTTIDLQIKDGGNICAIGQVECRWRYKVNDGGFSDWSLNLPINFPEESYHTLEIECADELGNTWTDTEYFTVDKTPPITTKTYGEPKYFEDNGRKWINIDTPITLTVDDAGPHKSGIKETKYRITTLVDDSYCDDDQYITPCSEAIGNDDLSGWQTYVDTPFKIGQESCHLIEYYSVDNVDKTEDVKKQCVFVDNTPPTPVKEVGEPKTIWDGADSDFYPWIANKCRADPTVENSCFDGQDCIDCWKITLDTPITMTCDDPDPHPVDNEKICFNVELDGDDWTESYCTEYDKKDGYDTEYNEYENGYCCLDKTIEDFTFLESSEHNLKFYCVDALGNTNQKVDEEKFKVEGNDFIIELNKKWNLISVPVVLLNDDPEEVFKDMSCVDTIWAYDPLKEMCNSGMEDNWCVYTPDTAPDNLNIIPGYGYWVLVKEECADPKLVIGGSLLSPGRTPPSRNLVPGWNLIGYYGMSGQDGYYGPNGNGDEAYCSLYSLVNTNAMIPVKRWSSLYGYWDSNSWSLGFYENGMCTELDPGAGYWIHLPADMEQYMYAPSTGCPTAFWDLICGIAS